LAPKAETFTPAEYTTMDLSTGQSQVPYFSHEERFLAGGMGCEERRNGLFQDERVVLDSTFPEAWHERCGIRQTAFHLKCLGPHSERTYLPNGGTMTFVCVVKELWHKTTRTVSAGLWLAGKYTNLFYVGFLYQRTVMRRIPMRPSRF
jgi:hypothetical protein